MLLLLSVWPLINLIFGFILGFQLNIIFNNFKLPALWVLFVYSGQVSLDFFSPYFLFFFSLLEPLICCCKIEQQNVKVFCC